MAGAKTRRKRIEQEQLRSCPSTPNGEYAKYPYHRCVGAFYVKITIGTCARNLFHACRLFVANNAPPRLLPTTHGAPGSGCFETRCFSSSPILTPSHHRHFRYRYRRLRCHFRCCCEIASTVWAAVPVLVLVALVPPFPPPWRPSESNQAKSHECESNDRNDSVRNHSGKRFHRAGFEMSGTRRRGSSRGRSHAGTRSGMGGTGSWNGGDGRSEQSKQIHRYAHTQAHGCKTGTRSTLSAFSPTRLSGRAPRKLNAFPFIPL